MRRWLDASWSLEEGNGGARRGLVQSDGGATQAALAEANFLDSEGVVIKDPRKNPEWRKVCNAAERSHVASIHLTGCPSIALGIQPSHPASIARQRSTWSPRIFHLATSGHIGEHLL